MSYMALYRKWRPASFDEVKGQDAIVRTLRNQIIYDHIGHAYLFCGTRGTGKTSIAKLFARTVNCEHPVDGSPCNECASCRAIQEQTSLDVLEIDAASNNGVDNVRELREQVQYSPVNGRYKVFIIDEVHMLSTAAFNALLKTLEEPPSYVIFILATTEKHKVPVTILSRCQKYDFKRISIDTIADHLAELMLKEGISVEEKALRYIARAADGSMRDALSLLDQCISFYLGQTISYDDVLEILGTVDTSVFSDLLRSILAQDTIHVLRIIDDTITEGRELNQFLSDFLWYLRNLLILKDQGDQENVEDSLDLSRDTIASLREEVSMVETSSLLRFIRVLSNLEGEMRSSSQKRVLMEVGFIRLCRPQMETDTESILERIRQLEEQYEHASTAWSVNPESGITLSENPMPSGTGLIRHTFQNADTSVSNAVENEQQSPEDILQRRFTPAERSDLQLIASHWTELVSHTGPMIRSCLEHVRPAVSEDSTLIKLIFPNDDRGLTNKKICESGDHLQEIADMIAQQTSKNVTLECVLESPDTANGTYVDLTALVQSKINFQIDVKE